MPRRRSRADGRYQVGALVQDANALHEVLGGGDDAVLIGHDWGALATYGAVAHQPERWRRAVTAAVPPTASIGMSLLTYAQLQKSWYMFFFLSPLAEAALPLDDYAFLEDLWRDWSPGYDGGVGRGAGQGVHRRPRAHCGGHLLLPRHVGPDAAGARAGRRAGGGAAADAEADAVPPRARRRAACSCRPWDPRSTSWPRDPRSRSIDDAGHFLHVERPDVVNRRILDFLTA